MCFVRISEQTANFALQNIKRLVFITEVKSVYSAVRTESLYKTDRLRLYRVSLWRTFLLRGVGSCLKIFADLVIGSVLSDAVVFN
jgi:hypothetical protein